jgi:hypothetical protein
VAGVSYGSPPRVLVAPHAQLKETLAALRAQQIIAVLAPERQPEEFARVHGYKAMLTPQTQGWLLERFDTGTRLCHEPQDAPVALWTKHHVA